MKAYERFQITTADHVTPEAVFLIEGRGEALLSLVNSSFWFVRWSTDSTLGAALYNAGETFRPTRNANAVIQKSAHDDFNEMSARRACKIVDRLETPAFFRMTCRNGDVVWSEQMDIAGMPVDHFAIGFCSKFNGIDADSLGDVIEMTATEGISQYGRHLAEDLCQWRDGVLESRGPVLGDKMALLKNAGEKRPLYVPGSGPGFLNRPGLRRSVDFLPDL